VADFGPPADEHLRDADGAAPAHAQNQIRSFVNWEKIELIPHKP